MRRFNILNKEINFITDLVTYLFTVFISLNNYICLSYSKIFSSILQYFLYIIYDITGYATRKPFLYYYIDNIIRNEIYTGIKPLIKEKRYYTS